MKKVSVLLFVLMFSMGSALFAQGSTDGYTYVEDNGSELSTSSQVQEGQMAIKPFTRKDYSHWSFSLNLGVNSFLGDMLPDYSVLYKEPLKHWGIGASAEYTINPAFSFGVAYMYNLTGAADARGHFESKIHHVYPFIGVNFLNYALFNRNKKWDLWFTIGVGAAHYNSTLHHEYHSAVQSSFTEQKWNETEGLGLATKKKWGGVLPVGVELDYNITKQIAVGLKYQHFAYTQDDIEGGNKLADPNEKYARKNYTYGGVSNDQMSNFVLSLRWNVTGKDKTHMRNLTWAESVASNDVKAAKDPRFDDLADRLDSLANVVANINCNPAGNNAGDNINQASNAGSDCVCPESYSIYFAFDKHNFNERSLIIISKVAAKMKEDPSLKVRIVGYTDIDGTNKYNDSLSTRRANNTKDELVKKWGISASRISTSGEGKLSSPDRTYHHVSRRCDFFFEK